MAHDKENFDADIRHSRGDAYDARALRDARAARDARSARSTRAAHNARDAYNVRATRNGARATNNARDAYDVRATRNGAHATNNARSAYDVRATHKDARGDLRPGVRAGAYGVAPAASANTRGNVFVSRALIITGILLFLLAALIAAYLIFQYADARDRYHKLRESIGLEVPMENNRVDKSFALEDIQIDWDALRARNPDVVAWIIIPGTHINYPIVKGSDNSYYLKRLFDGYSNGAGTIFADYQGSSQLNTPNNFFYGHNMRDGSMFSDLIMYRNLDYLNDHQVIYLATPECNYELRAIATLRIPGDAPVRIFSFDTQEDFAAYRDVLLSYATTQAQDLGSIRSEIESLYTFITCETENNRFRVAVATIPVRSIAS